MNSRRLTRFSFLLTPLLATWVMADVSTTTSTTNADLTPVATIGSTVLTQKQMQDDLESQLYESENRIYQMKKNWVDQKAKEILFTKAAADENMPLQAWKAKEILQKTVPPTQAEMDKAIKQYFPNGPAPSTATLQQLSSYLTTQKRTAREDEVYQQLAAKTPVTINLQRPAIPIINVTYGPNNPVMGPKDAPVTIIEFTDFQCPYCKRSQATLKQVEDAYKGKIKLVARQFPLPMHPRARPSANAALCANAQGKFWQYRDKLFPSQTLSDEDFQQFAKDVGLNMKKFNECLTAKKFDSVIDADIADGQKVGVNGTPHFYINGQSLNGAMPFEDFKSAIDTALAKK